MIVSPEEYDKGMRATDPTISVPDIVTPEQYDSGLTKPKMEEQSFISKHPNLYGTFGAAQSLIPYIKYIDPGERERFAKLSQQKQTRDLLVQNLETITIGGAGRIAKGMAPIIAKYLPKTYKAFKFIKTPVKEMGELARTPAKEVAEKGMVEAAVKLEKYLPKAKPTVTPKVKPAVVPEPVVDDPVKKIISAIKEAKPIRKAQEAIYSKERGERIGKAMAVGEKVPGEKGYHAQLAKLKGELTKVEFESIRAKVGQKDIDALFDIINKSADVTGFENITAKTGLAKLLGSQGGRVPTEGELTLLRKIFGPELTKGLLKKRTLWQKAKEVGLQLANIPRSVMASFDLSAPFRQGLFLIGHPKRFMQSFGKMFGQFGSERAYQAVRESITQKPTYELMKKARLALTEMGSQMSTREEAFMSQWAEKIPLVGIGIRASGRAHLGFLNKIRADVFEDLVLKAERLGLNPQKNMDLTKQIAKFVNAASGRGSLGSLEKAAVELNAFFFSPRLMASRLTLLNPAYYIKADPFVRKEALKSLLTVSGAVGTVLGLARAGGVKVGTDIRSADFGKMKVGNTRIDVMGGFQQYIRAAGQLVSGKYVSSTTGKVVTLGEGYRPLTRLEILTRQIESKEAPIFSFITTILKGQDVRGEKIKVSKEIVDRFKPMALMDIYEIAKEDPELLPLSALGMIGVGLQTYKPRISKTGGIKGF